PRSAGIPETSTGIGSSFVSRRSESRRIAATTNSKTGMSCCKAAGWPDRGLMADRQDPARFPGALVALRGDRPVIESYAGLADHQTCEPCGPGTRFQLAS